MTTKEKNKKINKKKQKNELIDKAKKFIISNKIEILVILAIFIVLTYIFFQFRLFVTYDSGKYFEYLWFLDGKFPISQWDPVRGPIYPIVLFIFTKIFGNNHFGVLLGNYLIYIGMIAIAYVILRKVFKEIYNNEVPIYLWVLFVVLFVFNPIMIGYQHLMLTESIIPIVFFVSSLLCIKYYTMTFNKSKKKFIIYSILLCILSSIAYFIKQPFAPVVWMSIFITAVLSGIYLKSWKEFGIKFLIFICSIIFTFAALICWNGIIKLNDGNDPHNSASSMTARGLIAMPFNFKRELPNSYCNEKFLDSHNLENEDYDKMKSIMQNDDWCEKIEVYNVYKSGSSYQKTEIIYKEKEDIGLSESIGFLLKLWFKYPTYSIHSYYENLLTITDLENVASKYDDFTPVAGLNAYVERENNDLALVIFNKGYNNVFWDPESDEPVYPEVFKINPRDDMKDYVTKTSDNERVSVIMKLLSPVAVTLFKFLMTFSVIFMIYSFVKFILHKNISYFVVTLFSGMAVTNLLFNVLFGANIDRYVYPTYIFMLLAFIICFADKREYNKKKVEK